MSPLIRTKWKSDIEANISSKVYLHKDVIKKPIFTENIKNFVTQDFVNIYDFKGLSLHKLL